MQVLVTVKRVVDYNVKVRGKVASVDEALACKRHEGISTFYIFGNMTGRRYTKGG